MDKGVFFGEALTRFVPPALMRRGAATLFVAMGAWMWFHPE